MQLFAVTSAAQVVQSSAVPNPKVSGQRCPGVTEVQVVGAATCGGPCGPCGPCGQVGQVGLAVQAVSMCQPSIMAKGHHDTKISCNVAMWHSSRPVTWLKSLTLAFPLTMASFRGHCGNMALGQEANGKAPKCCLQQQERHSGPIDTQVTRIITNANAPSSLVICLWNHAQAEWSSMIIRSISFISLVRRYAHLRAPRPVHIVCLITSHCLQTPNVALERVKLPKSALGTLPRGCLPASLGVGWHQHRHGVEQFDPGCTQVAGQQKPSAAPHR